jgi:hypothetical protein
MRADNNFFKRVDDWRRQEDDIPPCAEAARRLVEIGLQYDAPTRETARMGTSRRSPGSER